MRILIITGGTSSERKISLMSAKQVKEALESLGLKVKLFDFKLALKNPKIPRCSYISTSQVENN